MPDDEPTSGAPRKAPRPQRSRTSEIGTGMVVANRYRLDEHLGEGGMGSVWIGWDQQLERRVAVKFMSAAAVENEQLRSRFDREAKAAARLRTKHVVEVHDFGVDRGLPYMVMELLEGEDLRQRLKRLGKMPLDDVAAVVLQAAKALQRAEQAGIVHRDLKPANVFLARVDDEDVVKVLDFGVAKHTGDTDGSHRTKSGVVLGSPPYMSPEQARGKELDHRSDLWSLAAIAYRAACGRVPFSGDSDGDIIVKICTEAAPPPSSHYPNLDADVDAFFAKAFSRDPDDRFQSALELARAFHMVAGSTMPRATLSEIQTSTGLQAIDSQRGAQSSGDAQPSGDAQSSSGTQPSIGAEPSFVEDALTTPLTGATMSTEKILGPIEQGPLSGAPSKAVTAQTWIRDRVAGYGGPRRFVAWVAAVCVAALAIIAWAAIATDDAAESTATAPTAIPTDVAAAATPPTAETPDIDVAETPEPTRAPTAEPRASTKTDDAPATSVTASSSPPDEREAAAPKPRPRATPRPRAPKPTPRPVAKPTPKPAPQPGDPSWGY